MKTKLSLMVSFVFAGLLIVGIASAQTIGFNLFLPIVMRPEDPPTPTPTPTITPTPTKMPTPSPTTPPPPQSTGNIVITNIFANGSGSSEPDEYVEIKNMDSVRIQVQSWTLRDNANHVYTFPNFVMQPGQVCRIYTNQNHPEYCGFNYGSSAAIWNNTGDCAYLRDSTNALKSQKCY